MVGLQEKDSSTESASSEAKPSYLCITPDLVWSDIEESVKFKYQVFIFACSKFFLHIILGMGFITHRVIVCIFQSIRRPFSL